MEYIKDFKEGQSVNGVYLCSKLINGTTKTGNPFLSVNVRDKSGEINGKVWDPDSPGVDDFDVSDFIHIQGEVRSYQGQKQLTIRLVKMAKPGEYNTEHYFPQTNRDVEAMKQELFALIDSVKSDAFQKLLNSFFVEDKAFSEAFFSHTAAKSVHHNFIGGLLEHSLSVAGICAFFAEHYPMMDRDLIVSAGLLHDIGKVHELANYPTNDYTDEGQLLGHIVIGVQMIDEHLKDIPSFPKEKADELRHCILAHHGSLEFGSPKRPGLIEALALSFADNTDAKIETFKEAIEEAGPEDFGWQGYNRFLENYVRRTHPPIN